MRLIYVNEIGTDYEWYDIPASSTFTTKSPSVEYIDQVGLLKDTDIVFELIQNSDYFGIIDAVDGIVAMAWEKTNFDSEKDRLFFRFGETYEFITNKLKQRGITLENKKIKYYE